MASHTEGLLAVSTNPDVRIYYRIDGSLDDSRQVILLSNSLAATTQLWDDLVAFLRHTHTIVRYDARFHGQSPLSADSGFDYGRGHSMDDLAADVIALLNHLGIGTVALAIGLSIGAGVLLIAGATQPERFGHILVVGTKAQAPNGADAAFDARIAFGKQHGSLALGQQSVRRWFPEQWVQANPEKAAAVEAIVGAQSIEGFTANAAALRKLDLWPVVRDIQSRGDGSRFTFVAGEHDSDIPEDSRLLANVAGSETVIVRDAGHIVNVQQPGQFHALVQRVLESK